MAKRTLSLVVPCYNEEKTLARCIERVMRLQSDTLHLEIIIVDDCSQDRSLETALALAKAHPQISVLQHDRNQGKGAALRTGFLHATGDFVGIQDADDEYNPLEYITLLAPLLDGRADVVFGSRYLRPDTRRVLYFWHTQMNRVLTFCSNMFTDLGITDMETCYKLFKREIIQDIAPKLRENRFGFEPEVTALVAEKKCRVYECAISYNPRTYEEGKKIGWKDGLRALYCIFHYGAHRAPMPMQVAIYLFIGIVAALVNIGCFTGLLSAGFSMGAAIAAAFIRAAAVNDLLCITHLFQHKAYWSTAGELIAYTGTVAVMGLLDYAVTTGLLTLGLLPFWAKAWATVVGFAGNFIFRRWLVFREKTRD